MSQHGSASRSPEGSSPVNGTTVGFDLDQPTKRILCSHMTLPSNADPERAGSSVKQMVNRRNSRDKENSPTTLWGGVLLQAGVLYQSRSRVWQAFPVISRHSFSSGVTAPRVLITTLTSTFQASFGSSQSSWYFSTFCCSYLVKLFRLMCHD